MDDEFLPSEVEGEGQLVDLLGPVADLRGDVVAIEEEEVDAVAVGVPDRVDDQAEEEIGKEAGHRVEEVLHLGPRVDA